MSVKKTSYVGPFVSMVFLFFVIGFLTTVNSQFQAPLKEAFLKNAGNFRNTFATLITFSWFLAYPIFGPVGSSWVNSKGYKVTLLRGVGMMAAGLTLFFLSSWYTVHFPDSVMNAGKFVIPLGFLIFLVGSFVTGGSATVLQVVINPYLCACSIPGTQSVQRLAIGGTANSVGTTIAPYFVTGVVFSGVAMSDVKISQLTVPFICLAAIMATVLVILSRLALPDIEGTRNDTGKKLEKSIWSFSHLTLGVVAIFFYVGVETCVGANINMYAIDKGIASPALLATLYWGGMLIGRTTGSLLSRISPRTQLTFTTCSAAVLVVAAILLDNPWVLTAVGLFHSIMWGAIFTLSTARLGKYTSAASGVFMIGVLGGAVLPLLQGLLADTLGSWRITWYLVLVGEILMLLYAQVGSKVRTSSDGL